MNDENKIKGFAVIAVPSDTETKVNWQQTTQTDAPKPQYIEKHSGRLWDEQDMFRRIFGDPED